MNNSDTKQMLRLLFREALEPAEGPAGRHIADDDELLARWSRGELESREHTSVVEHLAGCPDCSDTLNVMLRTGTLELPDSESYADEPVDRGADELVEMGAGESAEVSVGSRAGLPMPTEDRPGAAWWRPAGMGFVVAASLAIACYFWFSGPRHTDPGLAVALTDFDYDLYGGRRGKSLPTISQQQIDRMKSLDARIADNTHDVESRLRYGHILLKTGDSSGARRQFEEVVRLEPRNPYARTALGAALFQQNQVSAALREFETAIERDPQRFAAQLNAAICLEKMKLPDRAVSHFKTAYQLAPDGASRQRIKDHLVKRGVQIAD